jgi:hypothetical protein
VAVAEIAPRCAEPTRMRPLQSCLWLQDITARRPRQMRTVTRSGLMHKHTVDRRLPAWITSVGSPNGPVRHTPAVVWRAGPALPPPAVSPGGLQQRPAHQSSCLPTSRAYQR